MTGLAVEEGRIGFRKKREVQRCLNYLIFTFLKQYKISEKFSHFRTTLKYEVDLPQVCCRPYNLLCHCHLGEKTQYRTTGGGYEIPSLYLLSKKANSPMK